MTSKTAAVVLLLVGLLTSVTSRPLSAQLPGARGAPAAPQAVEQPADPLGRNTPRGTVAGFSQAARRDELATAARYLQVGANQRNAETLSRDLAELIDRYFTQPVTNLSSAAGGTSDDGLSLDRERIVLTIDEKPVDLILVRINDRQSGLIWLFSSETLARVPGLRQSAGRTWLERVTPQALLDARFWGVSLARLVAWFITLLVPFGAMWLLSVGLVALARQTVANPARRRVLSAWYSGLRLPFVIVATLVAHLALVRLVGLFSLTFRLAYTRFVVVAGTVAFALFLWRLVALTLEQAGVSAGRRGQSGVQSLLLLSERVMKAVVVLLAILAILTIAGVDTTTTLAGLGIGGVALAFGAQRSVENLLGGVFLLTDKALAVGDFCNISNRVGIVEDVTLRSVRLRTLEQTLLSVPTSILSQSSVENFATRDKILIQTTLRLQYDTTVDQLTTVLRQIRALLDERSEIEQDSSRIRLVNFGERAIELELFAYVLTHDFLQFLAVQEELLLHIASIVQAAGTRFAQPVQSIGPEHEGRRSSGLTP